MKRTYQLFILISILFLFVILFSCKNKPVMPREIWSKEQAAEWYQQWGWLRGCNFQPSTAINQLEMWQKETFDLPTMNKELTWAANIGFNCMRVYLHHVAWKTDKEGFKKRMSQYLDIAEKKGISTIFVFFDDCWNATYSEGKQPEPKPGVHNSGWVRDPGDILFDNPSLNETLEVYVKDILTTFKNDKRIALWDLYNEPGNSGYGNKSIPLLKNVFEWAKTVNPSQPLSVGLWNNSLTEINRILIENSDIITYHNYSDKENHQQAIDSLKRYGRPLICTEYMARHQNSTFQEIMPVLKKENVGAINWGFVAGKTNTIFRWDEPLPDLQEPPLWFHDIFRRDGSPFSDEEIILIRSLCK